MTCFCFSEKIACGYPFHYLLIKMFWSLRAKRQGLPENFLNLIFNVIFYVALSKSLCLQCSGGLPYKTCFYKFWKIHRKHLSARLSFQLSCRDSACNFIKKETQAQMFPCKSFKVFKNMYFTEHLRATASVFCILFWSFG